MFRQVGTSMWAKPTAQCNWGKCVYYRRLQSNSRIGLPTHIHNLFAVPTEVKPFLYIPRARQVMSIKISGILPAFDILSLLKDCLENKSLVPSDRLQMVRPEKRLESTGLAMRAKVSNKCCHGQLIYFLILNYFSLRMLKN
jgi:hypothetical protein